jgi:cytidyltransferase-like protein
MGMIYDIHQLAELLDDYRDDHSIIATSGGFDPLHVGHLRCLQQSTQIAINPVLIVIVNGDGFLTRKKGKPFMSHDERMEIVNGIKGVNYVCGWDDGSQTVIGALEILKPKYFTKGGDRSEPDKVPEFDICTKVGCKIVFGVGGKEKAQSSSDLIKNAKM